jgi:hypothetical protein
MALSWIVTNQVCYDQCTFNWSILLVVDLVLLAVHQNAWLFLQSSTFEMYQGNRVKIWIFKFVEIKEMVQSLLGAANQRLDSSTGEIHKMKIWWRRLLRLVSRTLARVRRRAKSMRTLLVLNLGHRVKVPLLTKMKIYILIDLIMNEILPKYSGYIPPRYASVLIWKRENRSLWRLPWCVTLLYWKPQKCINLTSLRQFWLHEHIVYEMHKDRSSKLGITSSDSRQQTYRPIIFTSLHK